MAKSDCEEEAWMTQNDEERMSKEYAGNKNNMSFGNDAFDAFPSKKLTFLVTDSIENPRQTKSNQSLNSYPLSMTEIKTESSEDPGGNICRLYPSSAVRKTSKRWEEPIDCVSDNSLQPSALVAIKAERLEEENEYDTSGSSLSSYLSSMSETERFEEDIQDKSSCVKPLSVIKTGCFEEFSQYGLSSKAIKRLDGLGECSISSSLTVIKKERLEEELEDDVSDNGLTSEQSSVAVSRLKEEIEDDVSDNGLTFEQSSATVNRLEEEIEEDISDNDSSSYGGSDSDEKLVFECDSCDKTFSSESNFARHLIIHTEELPFDCDKLDSVIECQVDAGVKQFPIRKASANPEICGRDKNRQREIKSPAGDTFTFQCDICNVPFYSESVFAKHLISHCEDKPGDNSQVIPNQKSGTEVEKLFEFEKVGSGEPPNDKPIVLKKLGDDTIQFEVQKTDDGERLYQIEETEKGKEQVLCDQAILIEYKEMFFEIVRSGKGERRFLCKICDRSYTQKSSLNQHLRSHTGVKPYKCRTCEKTFARHSHLFQHERTHTGEKPFKCHICNASFTQKANVLHHQRVHTGEKPHKCHLCDRAFSQKSNLHYHVKIHSGEKPFRCEICNKTFNRKSNLTVHIKAHLRDKHVLPFM